MNIRCEIVDHRLNLADQLLGISLGLIIIVKYSAIHGLKLQVDPAFEIGKLIFNPAF
jgi:hypothetical protein